MSSYVAHVAFHVFAFENARAEVAFEATNFHSVKRSGFSIDVRVFDFSEAKELAIEGTFFSSLDLPSVRVALTRMDTAHMASKGLSSQEVFITSVTVELNRLDLCLVNAWLLCTLRLPNALAALMNRHFGTWALPVHLLQSLEEFELLAETLT